VSHGSPVKSKFNAAVNADLESDSDFDQYIDASITGDDRVLARRLMRLMPPSMRGDFIYYDGRRVVSNNAALIPHAFDLASLTNKPAATETTPQKTFSSALSGQRRTVQSVGSCSPPDPYAGSGPYVRMVSNCGFSGSFTIVNLPCGDTNLVNNDYGYMYLELRDQASNLYEAGLLVPSYSGGETQINPYLSSSTGLSLTNASERYSCGNNLAVMSGLIPVAGATNPMFMAVLGTVSNWSPSLAFTPTYTVTENDAAWVFTLDPKIAATPGNDPDGVPTACTGCSITKVTSIGQLGGDSADGSEFGVDLLGDPSIFWEDIRFGEWLAGSNSTLSTLEYSIFSSTWYAGQENYPNANAAFASVDPTQYGFQSYDGVSTVAGVSIDSHVRAASAFNMPAPPSCATDTHGYCLAMTTSEGTSTAPEATVCGSGQIGVTTQVTTTIYQVLNTHGVLTAYTNKVPKACPPGAWSPSNPKTSLGDPNLP